MNYRWNLVNFLQEKGNQYSKLMYKDDNGKLKVVKSFGKVSKLDKKILNKLLFLVRFSQYSHKLRELFSLELVILNSSFIYSTPKSQDNISKKSN